MNILSKVLIVGGFLFCFQYIQANKYTYLVDLVNVRNDKIKVELICPELPNSLIKFNFPKTIPGTYDISDFGKYISDLHAFNNEGEEIKYKKQGHNSYVFKDGSRLEKITYWVDDTWDSKVKRHSIFEPGGTGFKKDEYFAINNSGMFGYFDDHEKQKYDITFFKPENLSGFSSLEQTKSNTTSEKFSAPDYHKLVDCPFMFSVPDTVTFKVSNCKVTISVHHEGQIKVAPKIYQEIKPSMEAIEKFLGKIPVDNYTYLIYIEDAREEMNSIQEDPGIGSIFKLQKHDDIGALEHGNSSFYYLIDLGDSLISPQLMDMHYTGLLKNIAVHEFMHILTPLNLHSEEIGNFNYIEPKMSKHLWLYEGVTEYFSGIILLQSDIHSLNTYLQKELKEKIQTARKYPSDKMPITEMSENVLKKKYHKQYNHVYDRGAILALMLDIEIMKLTRGKLSLKDVVLELCQKYGQNNSFDDDKIIDEIVDMVHPNLKNFFNDYIEGTQPMDIAGYLNEIGIYFAESETTEKLTFMNPANGIIKNKINPIHVVLIGKFKVKEVTSSSKFQKGDILNWYRIEKKLYDNYTPAVKTGDTIYVNVLREGSIIKLPLIVGSRIISEKYVLKPVVLPTEKQQVLLNTWLNNKNKLKPKYTMKTN